MKKSKLLMAKIIKQLQDMFWEHLSFRPLSQFWTSIKTELGLLIKFKIMEQKSQSKVLNKSKTLRMSKVLKTQLIRKPLTIHLTNKMTKMMISLQIQLCHLIKKP